MWLSVVRKHTTLKVDRVRATRISFALESVIQLALLRQWEEVCAGLSGEGGAFIQMRRLAGGKG